MQQKQYIMFDLDGTLTDPGVGITNSVAYALKKLGITVTDTNMLYKFIGPPLWESFERYYGLTKEQADTAIEYYREYYNETGIYENAVYDGIEALLGTLAGQKKTLIVATSKPTVFAKRVLEHFKLDHYFVFIAGSELDGTRVKKDEVIAYAIEKCDISDPKQAVMIGDREHDILGAKKNNINVIGVLYGYGGIEELRSSGADHIASSVTELSELFKKQYNI